MTKQEINNALQELLANEDKAQLIQQGKPLLGHYQTALTLQHREALTQFTEAGGDPEEFTPPAKEEEDLKFDELWTEYKKRKIVFEAEVASAHEKNLEIKKGIITQILDITQNEEHIKTAFEKIKELEELWKNTGNVSPHEYKDLQQAYSRARDDFYYHMRIYRELLDHDLKRNSQLKEELAAKMEELLHFESIREAESMARRYLVEWDEIGPTYKEKWEEIRDRFRTAQHKFYDKVKNHYKSIKDQQVENLQKKAVLCEKIEEINSKEITIEKKWKKLTEVVIETQKEWKTIGFATKKENQEVWERFKAAADAFFSKKSEFYSGLKAQQEKNKERKQKLVLSANELKENTDWKETTKKMVNLQKEWQSVGKCHQRDEQKLWKQFREACNVFFEAKKNWFANLDNHLEENFTKKKEVIAELENFSTTDNKEEDLKAIKEISIKFEAIGFVPRDKKKEIQDEFKTAIDKLYTALGMNQKQLEKVRYESKLSSFANADNKDDLIDKEIRQLRDRMKKLEHNIQLTENNLGFFGHSKGAEKLREEQEKKLESSKKQLSEFKKKIKDLRNLLD